MFKAFAGLLSLALSAFPAAVMAQVHYQSQRDAQTDCPHDTVVWLNMISKVYTLQKEQSYGNTADGAYVCLHEAQAAGDHAFKRDE